MKIDFFENTAVSDLLTIDENELPYTYLSSYRNFIRKNYKADILIALAKEENTFIALSKHKTKFIVNAQLLSEPFTSEGALKPEDQEMFFAELVNELREQGIADRLITPQNFIVLGAAPEGSDSCRFGSYAVDLRGSVEELFSRVHPKHRNKINKAERAGVEIRSGKDELNVFYELYSETMKRSGMYCEPFVFFQSFYSCLGEQNCICSVVYHNNKPQGALLAPFTRYCCYYLYGASSGNITESGSINYLHWKTMLEVKRMGVRSYDFVGARLSDVSNTKLEGIQSFKERFGGELKEGYLFKMNLNQAKCRLFNTMLKMNNKLRNRKTFKDIIDQEIEKQA
ncbi:MAG: lipid II:glycine glycyltransferase FemX [Bacteroidia bacterium]